MLRVFVRLQNVLVKFALPGCHVGAPPSSALHDEATIRPMRPTKTYTVRVPGKIGIFEINDSGSFTSDREGSLNRDLREASALRHINLSLVATLLLHPGQKSIEK
ncbi:hypothetical protein [Paraburkholderia phenoliruptrix]|uniref:Uncharacterized protein n=1 Tax=Paraburkholderia phenoliruptrix TaxID=252970 RepID=A0ABV3WMW5_9BURK